MSLLGNHVKKATVQATAVGSSCQYHVPSGSPSALCAHQPDARSRAWLAWNPMPSGRGSLDREGQGNGKDRHGDTRPVFRSPSPSQSRKAWHRPATDKSGTSAASYWPSPPHGTPAHTERLVCCTASPREVLVFPQFPQLASMAACGRRHWTRWGLRTTDVGWGLGGSRVPPLRPRAGRTAPSVVHEMRIGFFSTWHQWPQKRQRTGVGNLADDRLLLVRILVPNSCQRCVERQARPCRAPAPATALVQV
jgi:hypothetical protein